MDHTGGKAGQTVILINSQSGTVRTMGAEAVKALVEREIQDWPGSRVQLLDGASIDDAVKEILKKGQTATIVVGGGDGTISSVAARLAGTETELGVLPLGTMNLMAKSLGIAPDLETALRQLEDGKTERIDIGRAGSHTFLHHVSLGIQPRMVRIRERLGYSSRLTKMLAGARAFLSVILKPQSLRLRGDIDGRPLEMKTPALVISNNLYSASTWLIQQRLDEGVLGIYATAPMSAPAFLRLAFDALRGRWRDNTNVQLDRGRRVRIEKRRRFGGRSRRILATLDGEITLLPSPVEISIVPLALKVRVPRPTAA